MTERITAELLKRAAIVYVRQSSPEHVRTQAESTRIQVGLRDKAVAFGWRDPVAMLDDLGISAGGFAQRAGFQHMAAEVSLGNVGIILCFEASRRSRNTTGWAPLFEICGHLDTPVADLDQLDDLALPDDRLILGVNGSVSEYELSFPELKTIRQYRILSAAKTYAQRSFFLVDQQGILRHQWLLGAVGDETVFPSEPILKVVREVAGKP